MKVMYIVGAIVLVVLAGAGGFYGGVTYAQSQSNNNALSAFQQQRAAGGNSQTGGTAGPCGFVSRNGAGGNRQFGQGGQTGQGGQSGQGGQGGQTGQGGNFAQLGQCVARGPIKSVNGNTIEVSTPVSVVTITVGSNTIISKTDTGSLSDLKPGDRVTVLSADSGTSPTASMISIQSGQVPGGQ